MTTTIKPRTVAKLKELLAPYIGTTKLYTQSRHAPRDAPKYTDCFRRFDKLKYSDYCKRYRCEPPIAWALKPMCEPATRNSLIVLTIKKGGQ